MTNASLTRLASCAAILALAGLAQGDVTYTFQDRAISATTSSNSNTQTLVAPGFGPFVEQLDLETTMVTPGGALAPNLARVGISNHLFPNPAAVQNLAHSYDFECASLSGPHNAYTRENPYRQFFRLTKR